MSSVHSSTETRHYAPTVNVSKVAGIATALVAVNILLILAGSYTPLADLGLVLFSNYFIGIGTFAATIGGGFWVSNKGIEAGNVPIAGAGVTLIQFGYTLLGSAILVLVPSALQVPALAITTVITGLLTAGIVVVVYRTDRSFARWQTYSRGLFIAGFAAGAVGFFLNPMLMVFASVLFFLGFVADLAYEIWAVKESRYASPIRNAIGIYVAVMGVFIHILRLVLYVLSLLNN
ncbi:Bax inhibitor-1 family protein [Natrinema amylolyticum]|uniref:Bax inhibitor-1 family protein n=1 Tax=Natrinema amylolyticum TaxID=2878679 RepID=UPI001CFC0E49|nr:Bax inhibitor-1 family protein [Natrinema amylolyticum]